MIISLLGVFLVLMAAAISDEARTRKDHFSWILYLILGLGLLTRRLWWP